MRRDGAALGLYALLAVLLTWPLAAHFGSAVPGLPGDNWQQYWNVWWVKRALLELHQSPYRTAELFHPTGADLHLHALNLVPILLVLPLAAVAGLTVAYNTVALLSFVLAGHGAYRLCLAVAWRGRAGAAPGAVHLAALLGGAVFTFSAYHFFYLQGPMALASVQWLPYFAWQLLESFRRPGARAPLLAGFFFVCAALTDWFHALSVLLFALAFVAWHALSCRPRACRAGLRRVGLAVAGGLLALTPVLVPALALARAIGHPADSEATAARLSGDLLGFLVPSPLHPFWQGRWVSVYQRLPGQAALTTFLGLVPLALALVAARGAAKRAGFWLAGAAAFAVMSLGPVLHVAGRALPLPLPAALLYHLPVAQLLRSPGRFVALVSLCLAVTATLAAIVLLGRARRRRRAGGWVAALTAGVVLENLAVPYPLSRVEVPSIYDSIAREPGAGVLLELPLVAAGGAVPERMLHQTRHRKPVLGGYPARGQPRLSWEMLPGFRELRALDPAVTDVVALEQPALAARTVLARHGVTTLVIDKQRAGPESVGRARGVVPALLPGATVIADDPTVLVYRLPAARGSASFLHLDGPDAGWRGLEPAASGPPGFPAHFRWMEERARLTLHAAEAGTWRLAVRGWAFRRPRRVALLVDGRRVGETVFGPEPGSYALAPFAAAAGWHALELRSLDGAEALSPESPARLSVAAAEIRLQAVPLLAEGTRVALGAAAADVYVGKGWSAPEGLFRWTDGPRATLFLPRATPDAAVLRLRVRPFVGGAARASQRLGLDWNGRRLGEVELHGPATLRAILEPSDGSTVPALSFYLPDAAPPARSGADHETRALGLAVEWLGIEAPPVVTAASVLPFVQAGWLAIEDEGHHPPPASAPPWPLVAAFALDRPAPVRLQAGLRLADAARPPVLSVRLNGREVEREGGAAGPRLAVILGPEAVSARSVLAVGPERSAPEGAPGALVEWMRLDPLPKLDLLSSLALGGSEDAPFLGTGWSEGEGAFRWTDGPAADLFFDGPPHAGALLELTLRGFLMPPAIPRQRVELRAGDRPIGSLDLSAPEVATHTLFVPAGALSGPSVLRFVLPDAVRPVEKGWGSETRRLGIALHTLRLRAIPSLAPQARLPLGGDEAEAFLGEGWSRGEGALRWTDGTRAELFVDLGAARPRVLQLRLRPRVDAAFPRQRLGVRLNGRDVATLTLTDPAPAVYAVALPEDAYAGQNRLELLTPDAAVPARAGAAPDRRRLGVAVYWLRFAPWF